MGNGINKSKVTPRSLIEKYIFLKIDENGTSFKPIVVKIAKLRVFF